MKEKIGRIASIDLIRGYFLFVILVDHFGRNFSVYDIFTGSGQQWVSAAEGFFFVSGLMIGLIRGRKMVDQPLRESTKKVLLRALQLYIWAVGLTVLFAASAQFFMGNPGLKVGAFYNEPVWKFITYTLTLRYNYGWADFLNYYAIYLALSPIALWLLRAKRWYILLAISFFVWVLGNNVQLTWQLLFFAGATSGFYLPEIEGWFNSLKTSVKRRIYIVFTTLGVSTIILSVLFNTIIDIAVRPTNGFNPFGSWAFALHDFNTYFLASYFDKYGLGYGRLILFSIWFIMLYLLTRRYETFISKKLGWFLTTMGQNSLYVYVVHAVLLFYINLFLPQHLPIWLNILTTTTFVGAIWYMTKCKFLFKYIPR